MNRIHSNLKTLKVSSSEKSINKNGLYSEEILLKSNKTKRKSIFDQTYDDGEKYNHKDLEDEEIKVDTTIKQKFDFFFKNDKFSNIISFISFIFAIYIFFGYVVCTYFPLNQFKWFDITNVAIATFYNIETIINIFLSQHAVIYLLSLQTIIELFTSIYPYFYDIDNFYNRKILEISRVCHLFRISKYLGNIYIENNITRCILEVSLSLSTAIFFFAAIFRIAELEDLQNLIMAPDNRIYVLSSQIKFHEFVYFTIITLFTLGYGEIYPISELGRVIIIILILYGVYLIQDIIKTIFNALRGTSVYSRITYKPREEIPYIVMCGNISIGAITSFCEELFHPDHGQSQKNLVILNKKRSDVYVTK